MRVVAIIQARLGSSRLPGKMLLPLHDRPVIQWAIERTRLCEALAETVVATTESPVDDELVAWCEAFGVPVFRGSEADVLDRVYQCARAFEPTHVLRATGDAPFNDPRIIDELVALCAADPELDYVSTVYMNHMTFPEGIGCECMPMRILELMAEEATLPSHREHVTPYVRFAPERFKHRHIDAPPGYAGLRLTVDRKDDLVPMNELARLLEARGVVPGFSLEDIGAVLDAHPELRLEVSGKRRDEWRRQVEEEEGRRLTELIIRADGGERIGAGHLMRCLALAAEWRRQGGAVRVVSDAPPALLARFEALEAALEPVEDASPEALEATLRKRPDGWVVLDGYHFTPAHHQAVRRAGHHLLIIDDMAHLPGYEADLLLNQNVTAERWREHYGGTAELLLGTEYVLLREEFAGRSPAARRFPARARRVLLTMGGADAPNLTMRLLRLLDAVPGEALAVTVLLGGANPHGEAVEAAGAASRHTVDIQRNARTVREFMEGADLAISAVGITCYEMAYLGVPALIIPYADNQYAAAEWLDTHGVMPSLGPADALDEMAAVEAMSDAIDDAAARRRWSQAGRELVDGRGASRLAEEMFARYGNL